jgi:hypothetical protein
MLAPEVSQPDRWCSAVPPLLNLTTEEPMPERAAPTTLESLSAMVPGSTPELLRWLDQQRRPVKARPRCSLRDTGWSDAVARQAFAQVVRWRSAPAPQAAPPIPEPDLRRSPTASMWATVPSRC